MSDIEYEVTDRFEVTLDDLVDSNGEPCSFPVELTVTSPGHGDKVVQQLEYYLRLACYDAAEDFNKEKIQKDNAPTAENESIPRSVKNE